MPELEALGATLVAVSPQLEEHSRSVAEEHGLSYAILGDPGNRTAAAFGLVFQFPEDMREFQRGFGLDLEVFNGDASWTLPVPSRFLIDGSRRIRHAVKAPDHTVRPDPSVTLDALRNLVGKKNDT